VTKNKKGVGNEWHTENWAVIPATVKLRFAAFREAALSFCIFRSDFIKKLSLYNIVDQFFIGRSVGMYGNAATNVALPLTTVCTALGLLFGVGGASNFNLKLGGR